MNYDVITIKKRKKKKKLFTIMSFNIKSCSLCSYNEFSDYIIKKNPDIICLQEVIYDENTGNILKNLSKYCYYYKFLKTVNKRNGSQYGIAIISKYPFTNYKQSYYDKYAEKRGNQSITVSFQNKKIKIVNTHLDYKLYTDYQLQKLFEKYCTENTDNKNIINILCGDFNDSPYNSVIQKYLHNYHKIDNKPTYVTKRTQMKLDYILVSNNAQKCKYTIDNTDISDHYPIFCNIK